MGNYYESSISAGINNNTCANLIRQLRQSDNSLIVIVEGSGDQVLFKKFIRKDCKISIAGGKEYALEVIDTLENENYKSIIAILDKDFQEIENELLKKHNVFYTDTHDLETMLLASGALEGVLNEYPPKKIIDSNEIDMTTKVRKNILECAKEIGSIRLISKRENLNLDFKKKKDDKKESLPFKKFISTERKSLNIDVDELIRVIKEKSKKYDIDTHALREKMKSIYDESIDLWQLCCGHDMINILSIGLSGSGITQDVTAEKIERYLRLAYETRDFQKTELFDSLVKWEKSNPAAVIIDHSKFI
jgi:5S rRNA maturation endonuclease (ribonuclease M5)